MKRNVVIPTDFSMDALKTLKEVLQHSQDNQQYNIILLHSALLDDSITDLMFYSKGKLLKKYSNEAFDHAVEIIQNKFGDRINSLRVDLFTGFTQSAWDNFVEANQVDMIYIPNNYTEASLPKQSIRLMDFMENGRAEIQEVSIQSTDSKASKGQVSEIFSNQVAG
jgi:hypothetical protein